MTFTLAICCYNFERFIEEAIDGAFTQTYRPLEIVISDDHSPDRSWEKILTKVASYGYKVPDLESVGTFHLPPPAVLSNIQPPTSKRTSGLTVVLNRNPKNLGLALHENKLFELSSGNYIAFQAGDDVSLPGRIAALSVAIDEDPGIRCLHSRCNVIDVSGKIVSYQDEFENNKGHLKESVTLPYVLGASAVYHRDVYDKFGPLGARVCNEDHVLPFRARMLGRIRFVHDPLVNYRKHDANLSGNDISQIPDVKVVASYRLRMVFMYYQELMDLHFAEVQGLIDGVTARKYQRIIEDQIFIMRFLASWILHSESRLGLMARLLLSPRYVVLFIRRVVARVV